MPGSTRPRLPPNGTFFATPNSTHEYTATPSASHVSATSETDNNPDTDYESDSDIDGESDSVLNTHHAPEYKPIQNVSRGSRECKASKVLAKRIAASMKSAVIKYTSQKSMDSPHTDELSRAEHILRFTQLNTEHPTWARSLGLPADPSLYRFEAVAAKKDGCFEPSMAVNIVTFRTDDSGDQVSATVSVRSLH